MAAGAIRWPGSACKLPLSALMLGFAPEQRRPIPDFLPLRQPPGAAQAIRRLKGMRFSTAGPAPGSAAPCRRPILADNAYDKDDA